MVEYTDLAVTPGRTPRGGVRKEHGLLRTPDGRAVDEEGLLRPASGGAAGAPQLAESLPSWWGPELAHPFWTENWAEADPFGSARQPVLHQEPKTPQPASRLGEQVNTSACKRRFSLGCVFTPIALFGQLFAAVDAVDLATVEQLVAAGAEINETDSDMGWSVLHHAINIPDEQSRVHMCVLTRLALASPHPEQALCLPAG